MVKTSIELPEEVWRAAKHRATDERSDLRTIIETALRRYLALPAKKEPKG
ncbi:MAG: hypothetical protein L0027_16720 [Candidatus Rokubacteria bacterium]|nr:hypothetical protein [Candidatus Rokubacteria bacterium]